MSTFFPTWIWQGREWSKWRIPKYDPHYWINAYSHPVISTFYPPSIIGAFFAANNGTDYAWFCLLLLILGHWTSSFLGWFILVHTFSNAFTAILGAITFTFSGYNWKQQPCFQYTVAWFPWLLLGIAKHSILLSGVSFGMILLAGYYPIGLQITLIAVGASLLWDSPLLWLPIGTLIGLPQLIPFLKYLPKTIRTNKVSSIGKVPWWHPITLFFPKSFRHYINGVGHWEMSYYVGILPLLLLGWSSSRVWILGVVSYFLMIGVGAKFLPRIPARWCFTFQFALGWMAVSGLSNLNLPPRLIWVVLFIQAWDLWLNNKDLLVNHPYAELYQKPSWAFNTRLTRFLKDNLNEKERVSGLPYPIFTGHINSINTLGYCGSMQLKLMAKWRNDKNPDGGGGHDYFRDNDDGEQTDRYRIRFAYTPKKLDWKPTGIRNLWENPRLRTSGC